VGRRAGYGWVVPAKARGGGEIAPLSPFLRYAKGKRQSGRFSAREPRCNGALPPDQQGDFCEAAFFTTSKALPGIDFSWLRLLSFQPFELAPVMYQLEPLSALMIP
jgi:hypothetical protein